MHHRRGHLLKALATMKPNYDVADIDVAITGRGLHQLFTFCNNGSHHILALITLGGDGILNYMSTQDYVRNTSEKLKSSTAMTVVQKFTAAGKCFEKALTVPVQGIPREASHKEVVMHKFGTLSLMVTSQVDAWAPIQPDEDTDEQKNFKSTT